MARRATEEEKAEMRRLRGLGLSYRAIGEAVGFGCTTTVYACDPKYKAYMKAYDQSPERKAAQEAYWQSSEHKAAQKAYRRTPEGKASIKAYAQSPGCKASMKAYRQSLGGKARQRIRCAERYAEDIQYKLAMLLRGRLRHALNGGYKAGSAIRDLGCSIAKLKIHLEAQFQPGMTWDNWEHDGWHIDHIQPLSSFDLTDRTQLKQACHFSNLQPLWAEENLSKGASAVMQ